MSDSKENLGVGSVRRDFHYYARVLKPVLVKLDPELYHKVINDKATILKDFKKGPYGVV